MTKTADHRSATLVSAPDLSLRPAQARLGYVDGLRAFAALWVVISHVEETVWSAHPPAGWNAELIGYNGRFAVSLFIVLSGFSLMLPVARNANHLPWGTWGFYWRRARRILPPYYIAMAVALVIDWLLIGRKTGVWWDTALPVTSQSVMTHLLLVQDLSARDHATINPVFWSIAVECQIYLLFPALVVLWRRYHPVFCAAIVLIASLLLTALLAPTWVGQIPLYAVASVTPQYIGLFALGMCAASLCVTNAAHWSQSHLWRVVDLGAVGGAALWAWTADSDRYVPLDVLIGVTCVCVLLMCARSVGSAWRNPLRAILEWRPLVWIGSFSYSLYLIHGPLVQILWQYVIHPLGLGPAVTFFSMLLVGGPLIVLAAWGFWWLCERPFLNSRATGKTRAGEVYRAETRPAATP